MVRSDSGVTKLVEYIQRPLISDAAVAAAVDVAEDKRCTKGGLVGSDGGGAEMGRVIWDLDLQDMIIDLDVS